MFLNIRPAGLRDLDECQYCLRDGFAYDAAARAQLVALWRELLESGAGDAAVIEDLTAPPGQRIVWFCSKVFLNDAYAHYLKTEAMPLVGLQALRDCRQGNRPFLSYAEVKRANATEGLTLLMLHSGYPQSMTPDTYREVIAPKTLDFYLYFGSGYRLREFLVEVYDEFTYRWAEGAGLRLRTDYARYYAANSLSLPPVGQRPRLYGAEEWEERQGLATLIEVFFNHCPPRFGFTRAEQEMLLYALTTVETDAQIAARLCLAPITVKKLWLSIYSRVEGVAPEALGGVHSGAEAASRTANRGREKKRWLLNYLRHHMEELRPCQK
jgi:hypothetical protein